MRGTSDDSHASKHEYLAHRQRVQSVKSVVNSQAPRQVAAAKQTQPREATFAEIINSMRTAIQRKKSNERRLNTTATHTLTTSSGANASTAQSKALVRTADTVKPQGALQLPSPPLKQQQQQQQSLIKSSMKLCKSAQLREIIHDKSAMLLYDCHSCGAFGCCCTCGGAGDGRHCASSCADMHEQFERKPLKGRRSNAVHDGRAPQNPNSLTYRVPPILSQPQTQPQLRHQQALRSASQSGNLSQPSAEQRAASAHARLGMPLRSFWPRFTRKKWNNDVRVTPRKPNRSTTSELGGCQRKKSVTFSEATKSATTSACKVSEKRSAGIPLPVLKRYQQIAVSSDDVMVRRLLRPRVYFDLEVRGIRPLGRLTIQLYTEACPEVVLEFVRMCATAESAERLSVTRLFAPLWLECKLALSDNKTLSAHRIEHDANVLDHGSGAGILSFPSRYVWGSKRRFLSFSISFKPLKVLNGKRIAFGRVKRGLWILDVVQDYGTNSGKPQREIVVTSCGLWN